MSEGKPLEGKEKVWERPWSIDEMRKGAQDWSLASDAGMLQYLQQFSQHLITRTHQIQEEVNGLLHEAKMTGVRINNTFGDFTMLANTQFVENRVYDEDLTGQTESEKDKPPDKEKTKEEKEAELIPRMTAAVQLGMQVIDTAFEKLDMNEANSDSEDDDSPYKADPIFEAKDPYLTRPLPYLIGTQAFFQDDDVGLVDVPSGDEMSDHGSISESESEEETDEDYKPQTNRQQLSESEEESEEDDDLFGTGQRKQEQEDLFDETESSDEEDDEEDVDYIDHNEPQDFASELSAKINAKPASKQTEAPKKEKHKRQVSKEADPFSGQDDEDDLFSGKNSMFTPKQGLFSGGGGLFDDDDDDDDGGVFPGNTSSKKSEPPKPTQHRVIPPAESEESDEDIPPKRLSQNSRPPQVNRHQHVDSDEEDDDDDDNGDLFSSLSSHPASTKPQSAAKSTNKVTTKPVAAAGLFGGDADDDLFADSVIKPPPIDTSSSKKKKTVDLFMDDDEEDDEGDLFASLSKSSSSSTVASVPEKKVEKKLPAGAVSMFGGAPNPLLSSLQSHHSPDQVAAEKDGRNHTSPDKSDSLFGESDNEEDVHDSPAPPHHLPAQTSSHSQKKSAQPSSSLFSESASDSEGDIFAGKPAPKKKLPAGAVSIFGGGTDPLTASVEKARSPSPTLPVKTQVTKPAAQKAVSLFGGSDEEQEDLFAAPPVTSKVAVTKSEEKPDLFGDLSSPEPSNDLFSSVKTSNKVKKPEAITSRGASLFDDGDLGTSPDDPSVDLFGPSSPIRTKSKSDGKTDSPLFDDMADGTVTKPSHSTSRKSPGVALPGFGGDSELLAKLKATRAAQKELSDDDDNTQHQSDQEEDKRSQSTEAGFKSKPTGAVSMFPGMPSSFIKSQKPSVKNEVKKEAASDGADLFSSESPLSGDQLFGASLPSLPSDATVGFDQPAKAETLHSVVKGRAKLPSGRKRPTRKPRQPSTPSTESDMPDTVTGADVSVKTTAPTIMTEPLDTVPHKEAPPPPQRTSSKLSNKPPAKVTNREDAEHQNASSDLFSQDTDMFKTSNTENGDLFQSDSVNRVESSPASDEPDMTSHSPKRNDSYKSTESQETVSQDHDWLSDENRFLNSSAVLKTSPPEDIFNSDSAATHTTPPPLDDNDDADDDDEDVAESNPKTDQPLLHKRASHHGVVLDEDFDVFDTPNLPQLTDDDIFGQAKRTNKVSVSPLDADDDDIFGSSKLPAAAAAAVDFDDDLFGPPKRSTKQNITVSEDDDLFGSLSLSKPTKSAAGDESDIFGVSMPPAKGSSPQVKVLGDDYDEDIFASSTFKPDHAVSAGSQVKKNSSAHQNKPALTTSLDDDDDIFASNSTTVKSRPQKAVTKDEDLFADDTDIFASIPKKEKKKSKSKNADKALFKDDVDDIFSPSSKSKSKISKPKNSKKTKTDDIFDEKAPSIFDDPLSALQ